MKQMTRLLYFVVAGLLLTAIGTAILFAPLAFHATNGITLLGDPNLLSEIRAPGALLAGSGIFVLISAFRPTLRSQAAQLCVLVFGAFGLARVISIALDGMPSSSLLGAMAIELGLASLGLLLLLGRSTQRASASNRVLRRSA